MTDLATDPGWRRLLAAARRSLERTGGRLEGTVSLTAPTDAERLVVIGVTGVHRPAGVARTTVRLAELDDHLFGAYGVSLADALGPLRNRPAEREGDATARDALLALGAAGRHASEPWYGDWLDTLRRDGALTRIARAAVPFEQVVAVLDALPAADEPMPVFAERVLGDTKALADGPVRGLVQRALAGWQGLPVAANAEQERALWELVGVVPDDLASQVLVLNLPAQGGLLGSWLTSACGAHVPLRVTLHQLRLAPLLVDCAEIFVCENPAVLRAAAGRPSAPLVCTEGTPSAAAHLLLGAAPRARISWRNDFDWTGVRLTAGALARYPNAVPWRMDAATYTAATPGTPAPGLVGTPTTTPWDPPLADAMRASGRPVMEERLLRTLLADIGSAMHDLPEPPPVLVVSTHA